MTFFQQSTKTPAKRKRPEASDFFELEEDANLSMQELEYPPPPDLDHLPQDFTSWEELSESSSIFEDGRDEEEEYCPPGDAPDYLPKGCTYGPPTSGKSQEAQILQKARPERDPPLLTPLHYSIYRRHLHTTKEAKLKLISAQEILRTGKYSNVKCPGPPPRCDPLRQFSPQYLRALKNRHPFQVGDYKAGDTVLLFSRSLKLWKLLENEEISQLELLPHLQFAHLLEPTKTKKSFHALILCHAQGTFLQQIGRSDELFAFGYADISSIDIAQKLDVLFIGPKEPPPMYGTLPEDITFFCSLFYNIHEASWVSFDLSKPGILQHTSLHPGDYIRVRSNNNLCEFAVVSPAMPVQHHPSQYLCMKLQRRYPEDPHSHELVLVKGMLVNIPVDDIIGTAPIQYSQHPIRDGVWWFCNSVSREQFCSADVQPILSDDCVSCTICTPQRSEYETHLRHQPCMRLLDLFAGAGGLSHGLSGTQHIEPIVSVEVSPSACATLRNNMPPKSKVVEASCNEYLRHLVACTRKCICKCRLQHDSKFDIISFGPPCPDNSKLNQYQKGARNLHFGTALSCCDLLDASYVVIENVQDFYWRELQGHSDEGLENQMKYSSLSLTIQGLFENGYQLQFSILNAQHYGAPQSRKRFFLIAAQKGLTLPMLPLPTHFCEGSDNASMMRFEFSGHTIESKPPRAKGCAMYMAPNVKDTTSDLPKFNWPKFLKPDTLLSPAWIGFEEAPYAEDPQTPFQDYLRKGSKSVTQHYTPMYSQEMMQRVWSIPQHAGANYTNIPIPQQEWQFAAAEAAKPRGGYKPGQYQRLPATGHFPAVTTKDRPDAKQASGLHYTEKRTYTIRERARMQTFPDNWLFASTTGSVEDMNRQIGNAVPPVIGQAIAASILEARFVDWKARGTRDKPIEIDD